MYSHEEGVCPVCAGMSVVLCNVPGTAYQYIDFKNYDSRALGLLTNAYDAKFTTPQSF
jgi:hypothetical protein